MKPFGLDNCVGIWQWHNTCCLNWVKTVIFLTWRHHVARSDMRFYKKSQKFCYINSKYRTINNIWNVVLWRIISLCGIAHDEALFVCFEFVLAKCRGCQHQILGGRFRWELLIYYQLLISVFAYWIFSAIKKHMTNHYRDVVMGALVSQMTRVTIVYRTVCPDADQKRT